MLRLLVQDGYAGDIGDFGKFALLRTIARTAGLRIGLHWCLTSAGTRANDGRHTRYLSSRAGRERYRSRDPDLYDALARIVGAGTRSVARLEEAGLLPTSAVYFSERLDYDGLSRDERRTLRERWRARAASAFRACDLLLLDADNGLAVPSVSATALTAPKYVYHEDLERYRSDQTIAVYQHVARSGSAEEQLRRKLRSLSAVRPGSAPFAIRHRRGTSRAYLFLPALAHVGGLRRAVARLLDDWPDDFHHFVP